MLVYIINQDNEFDILGKEDRFKFLMDTPDEDLINCVAKYVFWVLFSKCP